MPIAIAVQKGRFVYVHDERNRSLFKKGGELHGYTSASVSVKSGSWIHTYDEKGRKIGSTKAG